MVAGEQHKTNPVTIVTTTLTICFAFSRDVSEHWLIVYLEFSATWAWTGLWSKKLLLRRRTLPLKQKAQHEDNCLSKSFVSTPIHSSIFNRLETKESWKGPGILAATQVERMKRKGHSFESISGRRIGKTSAPSEDIDRLRTGQCSQSTQGKKHIEWTTSPYKKLALFTKSQNPPYISVSFDGKIKIRRIRSDMAMLRIMQMLVVRMLFFL